MAEPVQRRRHPAGQLPPSVRVQAGGEVLRVQRVGRVDEHAGPVVAVQHDQPGALEVVDRADAGDLLDDLPGRRPGQREHLEALA